MYTKIIKNTIFKKEKKRNKRKERISTSL